MFIESNSYDFGDQKMHPLEYFLVRMTCLKPDVTREERDQLLLSLASYSHNYDYPDTSTWHVPNALTEDERRIREALEVISFDPSNRQSEDS